MPEHNRVETSPPPVDDPVEDQTEGSSTDEGPIEGNGSDPTGGDRPPTADPQDSRNERRLALAPR